MSDRAPSAPARPPPPRLSGPLVPVSAGWGPAGTGSQAARSPPGLRALPARPVPFHRWPFSRGAGQAGCPPGARPASRGPPAPQSVSFPASLCLSATAPRFLFQTLRGGLGGVPAHVPGTMSGSVHGALLLLPCVCSTGED